MSENGKRRLAVEPAFDCAPEIGPWLWAIDDTRKETQPLFDGLTQEVVDWIPPEGGSSIGTQLYHLAVIEASWLYDEVVVGPYPAEIEALFPYPHRDEQGNLTMVRGLSPESYVERLDLIRARLIETFVTMTGEDFRTIRSLPPYDVTPEWVLHHLMQHEAEHRSEIANLRARAEASAAKPV